MVSLRKGEDWQDMQLNGGASQAYFGNDLHCWVTLKEEGKVLANIILWKKEGLEKDWD